MNLEASWQTMIRIHKTSWQTMIRIRRTKLERANSKIRMEPEASEEGQSNSAGKHPLTDQLPGRNIALLWKSGKSRSLA